MPALSASPTRPARTEQSSTVSIETARKLIGKPGRPMGRQTILAEALRGRLDVLQTPHGFVVPLASVEAYKRLVISEATNAER